MIADVERNSGGKQEPQVIQASGHPAPDGWVSAGLGEQPALLSIHTWGDEVRNDAALAAALGDRAVISLLRPDPAITSIPTDVEGWVAFHLAVIATIPADPPYWLLGWSFGGVVALELGRELEARGIPVAYVGMVDAVRPLRLSGQLLLFARKVAKTSGWVERWKLISTKARLFVDQVRVGLRENRGETTRHLGLRRKSAPIQPSATKDSYAAAIHASYLSYVPRPTDLPVVIFACDRSIDALGGPSLGWAPYLKEGFECYRLEGDHRTIFAGQNLDANAALVASSLVSVPR